MRHGRSHPVDDAEEFLGTIGPAHRPQHPVGSRLQWHVQVGAHVRGLRHGFNDVIGELGRVRRGEPHPFETFDLTAGAQQRGEGPAVPGNFRLSERDPVGVDVLAEQGDFQDTLVHQGTDLCQDVGRTAIDFPAAQRRHNAERAGVVAAHRYGDPRRIRGFTGRGQRRGEFAQCFGDLDLGGAVVSGTFQQHR